jgi:glutamyl-tRNA(Gln) amidotransferase subunit E
LGTIRQDVNVSIDGGERVELKGFQDLSTMAKVVEKEINRQEKLKNLKKGIVKNKKDVTDLIEENRGEALACKLVGWNGLLGTKGSPEGHVRMGREIADHAIKAGVKGLMHSDELPAYGISEKETKKIYGAVDCKKDDAFILIFDNEGGAKKALENVIQRVESRGVPKEVRKVTPEGHTRYLRPMPGASRMYPETDIAPINLQNIKVEVPKTLNQREKELPINAEESKQMVSRNLDSRFQKLFEQINDYKNLSRVLLHTIPNLESKGNFVVDDDIIKVLLLVKEGKIAKEGIENALVQSSEGEKIEVGDDNIEKDVELFIDKLIKDRMDFVKNKGVEAVGPLMGDVMAEFRGKMDGAKINALLMDRIKKVI